MTENRPWGYYTIIDEDIGFKVKRIFVKPGARLSYQVHEKRDEYWTIIHGSGVFTLNDEETIVETGDQLIIPAGALHRIAGGDVGLAFIEVQLGSYLGEDDIKRIEDDYGR